MSGTKNMGLGSKRVCGKLEGTGLTALVLLKERMQHGDLQGQRGGWSMDGPCMEGGDGGTYCLDRNCCGDFFGFSGDEGWKQSAFLLQVEVFCC